MPDRPNLIYRYDGSFDGLLCCVFESYAAKEIPTDIVSDALPQTTLFPIKDIPTDPQKAKRVQLSIPEKMGDEMLEFVQHAFLTCLPQKERYILLFLRLGYRLGPAVRNHLADPTVDTLQKAVRHLGNESHLLKGFIRFSSFGDALVAEIEPKNIVLPLLSWHFRSRYPEERFLILDKTHGMALVYRPHTARIVPVEELVFPEPDETEQAMRTLWKQYYDTIEIKGRHNPRCRMGHMPKRYWGNLTEFEHGPTGLHDPFAEPTASHKRPNAWLPKGSRDS